MTDPSPDLHPGPASWIAVALAWIAVGIPLLWGVLVTIKKAAPLFR
jgi:predicted signal transduction protein with EAL and GGDEF domain